MGEALVTFVQSFPLFKQSPNQRLYQCSHVGGKRDGTYYRRRGRVTASAAEKDDDDVILPAVPYDSNIMTDEIMADELVSDDTHVVIDSSDIKDLLQRLQLSDGIMDNVGTEHEDEPVTAEGETTAVEPEVLDASFDAEFFNEAERLSDAKEGRETVFEESTASVSDTVVDKGEEKLISEGESEDENDVSFVPMDYFVSDNVTYMPSWVREMYENNTHVELEEASKKLMKDGSFQRLHDIVARKQSEGDAEDDLAVGDGIVDCSIGDVADDYNVPVEFVMDAMISYGVPTPLAASQSVRDSMTTEEVTQLLKLITTFDSVDLSDRYSDRTIAELSEDYDIPAEDILLVCEKEGLYVHAESDTRLSVVREDRVMNILIKADPRGKPYPPLLEGLE